MTEGLLRWPLWIGGPQFFCIMPFVLLLLNENVGPMALEKGFTGKEAHQLKPAVLVVQRFEFKILSPLLRMTGLLRAIAESQILVPIVVLASF